MIAHTIQLALTPVFVLVAIGNILATLTNRLGRIVDRARHLQERHGETSGADHDLVVSEMRALDQRNDLITKAIRVMVMGALSIGTTVAVLFVQELTRTSLETVAAGFFMLAIIMLMWALVLFLRETQVAAEHLKIPRDYLELHRDL